LDLEFFWLPPVARLLLALLMSKKKVFVSGCFDLLHSGHIRFLEKAAVISSWSQRMNSRKPLK
jgi:FAD synthase